MQLSKTLIIIDRLLKLGFAFLTGVLAAKTYGAHSYGDLSYALAFNSVLTTISLLGIEAVVVREIACNKVNSRRIIGSLLFVFLITSWLVFVAGLFYINMIGESGARLSVVSIVSISLLFQTLYPSLLLAQANNNFLLISTASILTTIVVSAFRFFVVKNDLNIFYYASTYPAEIALNYLILYSFVIKRVGIKICADLDVLKKSRIFDNGWKLLLSALVMVVLGKVDQLIIGSYLNSYSLGIYSVASRIVDAALTIPFSVLLFSSTRLYEYKSYDEKLYMNAIAKLARFCFFYAILFITFVFLVGDRVVELIFGSDYLESSEILKILSFNVLFLSVGQLLHYVAISIGQENYIIKKVLLAFPLYIIVLFLFVSKYGLIGAALANIFMYFFSSIVLTFVFKRQRWQVFHLFSSLGKIK